jgi:F-type H+-transporting ATPase subunit epsilon
MMQLKVLIPSRVILDTKVDKIVCEDTNGSFCILPKHIDCVRILIPSILSFSYQNVEKYIGIDEGIFVKCKKHVSISVKKAISDVELGEIKKGLEENLQNLDEDEKKIKRILTELEMDFIKRYTEIKKL